MKLKITLVFVLLWSNSHLIGQEDTIFNGFKLSKEKYLVKELHSKSPKLFNPFFINMKYHHFHSTPVFNNNMDELFFSVYINNEFPQKIYHLEKKNRVWSPPKLLWFSGQYQEGGPVISNNGKILYFYSKRPTRNEKGESDYARIWYSIKENGKWSIPQLFKLPEEVGMNYYPSYAQGDKLIFSAQINDTDFDIFQCEVVNNQPIKIVKLDTVNNVGLIDTGAVVNNRYQILVYSVYNLYGKNQMTLFYSLKKGQSWEKPNKINSDKVYPNSRFPQFSPDGKYFFFTNSQSGYEQVYWMLSKDVFDLKISN